MFIGLISGGREKCESDKIGVRTREALCVRAGAGERRKRRRPGVALSRISRRSVGTPLPLLRNVNCGTNQCQRDTYFLIRLQSQQYVMLYRPIRFKYQKVCYPNMSIINNIKITIEKTGNISCPLGLYLEIVLKQFQAKESWTEQTKRNRRQLRMQTNPEHSAEHRKIYLMNNMIVIKRNKTN